MDQFNQNYSWGSWNSWSNEMYTGDPNGYYEPGCTPLFSWGFSAPSLFSQQSWSAQWGTGNGVHSNTDHIQHEENQIEEDVYEEDEETKQQLIQKVEDLRQKYAEIEAEKAARHEAYTQILEAEYGERIKTLQNHLQIAKKYISQGEESLFDEETKLRRKINLFEAEKQEINDIKFDRQQMQWVSAKTQLYLKQLILQGGQKYKIFKQTCMAEKKGLFQEFTTISNKKDEMLKKLNMMKAENENLMAQKSELKDKLVMLSEENTQANEDKDFLEEENAKYKERNDEKSEILEEQKNKIYILEKEKFELNQIKKPKIPKRSWRRRFLSFFCIRSNVD